MNFYDFLWSAVKRPQLIREYAERVGVSIAINQAGDFYERLRDVAKAAVEIIEIEARYVGPLPQLKDRCRDVRRFVAEAIEDLIEAGRETGDLRMPNC